MKKKVLNTLEKYYTGTLMYVILRDMNKNVKYYIYGTHQSTRDPAFSSPVCERAAQGGSARPSETSWGHSNVAEFRQARGACAVNCFSRHQSSDAG